MIVRARLRKYLEEGKASDSLPTDYDPARGILDSLNNVMQTKFCEGYYFGESAERKNADFFEALGVSVPGPETERNRITKTKKKQNSRKSAVYSEAGLRRIH